MNAESKQAIGIDLGTTFSAVAYLDRSGVPQTILNMEGDLSTPSVVYFDENEAVASRVRHRDFNDLGRSLLDPKVDTGFHHLRPRSLHAAPVRHRGTGHL